MPSTKMREYILSCCSTADLTKEHFEERNISYICFHYIMDGKMYDDDLGVSMPFKDFYQAMRDGADTKTSQINEAEFTEYFENKTMDDTQSVLEDIAEDYSYYTITGNTVLAVESIYDYLNS